MRKYYKAYYLKDLRQFSGWTENPAANEPELSDNTICYVGDNFVVVRSPVQDKEPVYDQVTTAWQEFCSNTLHFEIPEDLRQTSAKEEQESNITESAAV